MNVLVTGATGVIGQRLVPLLTAAGHQVSGLARSAEKRALLEKAGARAVEGDLLDASSVRRMVEGHETVINLATHIPPSSKMILRSAWRENDRLRTTASALLADAALKTGVERFVQESFALIYPDRGDTWITEETPLQPVSYNVSVLDAERSAARFMDAGRTGVVLRFAGFYGTDDVTKQMAGAVRKGWAPVPGGPHLRQSAVSHHDAARATAAAIDAPAGIYNVVDDDPLPRREFFDSLADALGTRHPRLLPSWTRFLFGTLGGLTIRSIRMSNRKLKAATGWEPDYPSVREGWAVILEEIASGE